MNSQKKKLLPILLAIFILVALCLLKGMISSNETGDVSQPASTVEEVADSGTNDSPPNETEVVTTLDDERSDSSIDVDAEMNDASSLAAASEEEIGDNFHDSKWISEDAEGSDISDGSEKVGDEPEDVSDETTDLLDENGSYSSKEDVALYIYTYGKLPSNYITKQEAEDLGWSGGSIEKYAPGKSIGGGKFGNYEELLPTKKGRKYYECDIDTVGKSSRGAKRIVFSNDGLIYYTEDHYETFELLYGTP